MANKSKVQSVEPDIADLVNGWLKSYGLDYKLEQASLNSEIDIRKLLILSDSASQNLIFSLKRNIMRVKSTRKTVLIGISLLQLTQSQRLRTSKRP